MLTEFKPGETKTFIQGPVGRLESLISIPTQLKNLVVVICHPHPLFGGTMHNKVVYTMARAFKELGLITVRFNFRGVGESEGSYAEGIGETEDLQAILHWLKQARPLDEIWLAGFSFGAYVASRGASLDPGVKQLVSVAPPVQSFDFSGLAMPQCPWLVIQGEQDEIVAPEAVYNWLEKLDPPPQLIKIKEAGHFFHGKLIDLKQAIKTALQDGISA